MMLLQMSSFSKKGYIQKCIHCSNNFSLKFNKCPKCKLWKIGTPQHIIPKNDIIYNIKDVYVINLEKDKRRLSFFTDNIKKFNVSTKNRNWNRFTAINGTDFNIIEKELYEIPEKTRKTVIEYWKKYPGSIGCYLSHIKLWKHIYEDKNSGEYTLILEDDSFFTPHGLINIELVLKDITKLNWDLLYTGHNLLKGTKISSLILKPYQTNPNENNRGFNSGLFGYIIRKSSIPKLLYIVKQFQSPFIDVQIRNSFGNNPNSINGLFIINSLIRHNDSGSSSRKNFDNKI